LLIAEHDEGKLPARQVLLVTHVFVGGKQKLETGGLSLRYQFAVYQPVPPAGGAPRLRAANSITATTCSCDK
jgi:hypothetical protein